MCTAVLHVLSLTKALLHRFFYYTLTKCISRYVGRGETVTGAVWWSIPLFDTTCSGLYFFASLAAAGVRRVSFRLN